MNFSAHEITSPLRSRASGAAKSENPAGAPGGQSAAGAAFLVALALTSMAQGRQGEEDFEELDARAAECPDTATRRSGDGVQGAVTAPIIACAATGGQMGNASVEAAGLIERGAAEQNGVNRATPAGIGDRGVRLLSIYDPDRGSSVVDSASNGNAADSYRLCPEIIFAPRDNVGSRRAAALNSLFDRDVSGVNANLATEAEEVVFTAHDASTEESNEETLTRSARGAGSQALMDVSSASMAEGRLDAGVGNPDWPTINFRLLESHLPVTVAHTVTTLAGEKGESPTAVFEITGSAMHRLDERTPLKILKFELEPASLGAVQVKMRMTQSRVEIEIDVQSVSTLSILHDIKDKLTNAVGATGCAVEALDIGIVPSNSPPDAGRVGSDEGGQAYPQGFQPGARGFGDSDRSGQRRGAHDANLAVDPRSGEPHSPVRAHGVYL